MKKKTKIILSILISVLILILLILNTIREDKIIKQFEQYLNSHKTEFSEYMIGKEEKEYKQLKKKADRAIDHKNVKIVPELESQMNELINRAKTDNEKILNNQLNDIRNFDLSKFSDSKKKSIKDEIKEIQSLIDNKKYSDASKKIKNLKNKMYSSINN
ncbi:hypothetical protein [Clostridium sp.]|uniref:hypothetical protein n=1 Tax=Clostridium sp. TaxID=1506 RepID=UPI0026DC73C8|nr:hypothetical protein [Clostridium sp.]MDO5038871.1 hypothetical protein [Clostridium sp.]